jgi:hypothetical protein
MTSKLPDFLIIGAPKSGTTSLYHYIAQHPRVFMSAVKEPRYFAFPDRRPTYRGTGGRRYNRQVIWKFADYQRLFANCRDHTVAGEASATYLWSPSAPAAIRRVIPGARLVAILRQPADRAFSHYCHNRRMGLEPLDDFEAALAAEAPRIAQGWCPNVHYRARGRYAEQLARYLSVFPREQLRIFLYEELEQQTARVVADLCAFIGVEPRTLDVSTRHNVTLGLPRHPWLHRLIASETTGRAIARRLLPESVRRAVFQKIYLRNLDPVAPPRPEVRRALTEYFRDDIGALERLTDRDLSAWLR